MRILTIIAVFFPLFMLGQTVEYDYDNAGNRTLRRVFLMKTDSSFNIPPNNKEYSDIEKTSLVSYVDVIGDNKVTIYPNPSVGQVSISLGNSEIKPNSKILLHTINGALIYEDEIKDPITTIDISTRENGTYLLSIIISGHKSVWKIIKQ
jgi:hypothetical protein